MTEPATARPEDVAVIVPNYNKKKTLRACLEAVYAQTYPPAEVIVVDDRSTDGSLDIAREFPCTIVELPTNQGPSGARNTGVDSSTSPLLFFVDSDTALAPDAVENAVRAYRETPDCGMVQGIYDKEPLYDDGLVERYRVFSEHFDRQRAVSTFLSNSLIPRTVYREAGGLDERLRDGEDFEFGNRVPSRYRLVVTATVVTKADDVDRFWECMWERFVRASTLPVIMLRARRLYDDDTIGFRLDMIGPDPRTRRLPPRISSVSAALSLFTLPFVFLAPWLLVVLALLLTAFVTVNRDFLRYSHRHRGAGFAFQMAVMQFCYHTAFFLGAGAGLPRLVYELLRRQGHPAKTGLTPVSPAGAPE
ncbi:glycosyltransferase family 2 protein [Streptosporangium sp. OZ121]|uniref:glycosyltransferase family 2 protein n=1 Tax=Streptosporangium sp. OZ121 TaxID=3444183 RepID=UPI003F7AEE7F